MKKAKNENKKSNVINFKSIKRTASGWAIFIDGVVFVNDGLLDYIQKNQANNSTKKRVA